ncbi:MAG: PilW family protein, partial [Solirubrobacteraceae bacterium]
LHPRRRAADLVDTRANPVKTGRNPATMPFFGCSCASLLRNSGDGHAGNRPAQAPHQRPARPRTLKRGARAAETCDGTSNPRALVMIDTFPPDKADLRSEAAFTLVEMMIAMSIAAVIFGALIAMLGSSQRVQARDTERAEVLQAGRVGLARMTREIRQASGNSSGVEGVEEIKPGSIEFRALIGGKKLKIKYNCEVEDKGAVTQKGTQLDECVRYAAIEPAALPTTGEAVVLDVANPTTVFKYFKGTAETSTKSEVYVATLKIELPASGKLKQAGSVAYKQNIVLEDAAYMRNRELKG